MGTCLDSPHPSFRRSCYTTEELVSDTAHPDACHPLSTPFPESPGKAFGHSPLPWPLGEEDPVARSFMAIACSGCGMDLSAYPGYLEALEIRDGARGPNAALARSYLLPTSGDVSPS